MQPLLRIFICVFFFLHLFENVRSFLAPCLAPQKIDFSQLAHVSFHHGLPSLHLWEILTRYTSESINIFCLILEHHIIYLCIIWSIILILYIIYWCHSQICSFDFCNVKEGVHVRLFFFALCVVCRFVHT